MAAVFPSFHSNRPLQTQNGCIFAFKSKQQCSLTKMSKFVALLKKLEKSPAHCLNVFFSTACNYERKLMTQKVEME